MVKVRADKLTTEGKIRDKYGGNGMNCRQMKGYRRIKKSVASSLAGTKPTI
jgi:hypothetical protein